MNPHAPSKGVLVIPSRVIASCFALVSFAAALVIGLFAGNSAGVLIWRATLVMIACWIIGRIVGGVAQRVIDDHVERYKRRHPLPEDQEADEVGDADEHELAVESAAAAEPRAA